MKVAILSSIEHAGMTFQPHTWAIVSAEGSDNELVYIGSMLQVSLPDTSECFEYVQIFRFSFKQLNIEKEANRLRVSTATFQKVLDAAPPRVTRVFAPLRCNLRGRWVWTAKHFASWANAGSLCRSIHLSSASETELLFTFR